jgi:hypothetical protein
VQTCSSKRNNPSPPRSQVRPSSFLPCHPLPQAIVKLHLCFVSPPLHVATVNLSPLRVTQCPGVPAGWIVQPTAWGSPKAGSHERQEMFHWRGRTRGGARSAMEERASSRMEQHEPAGSSRSSTWSTTAIYPHRGIRRTSVLDCSAGGQRSAFGFRTKRLLPLHHKHNSPDGERLSASLDGLDVPGEALRRRRLDVGVLRHEALVPAEMMLGDSERASDELERSPTWSTPIRRRLPRGNIRVGGGYLRLGPSGENLRSEARRTL